MIDFDVKGRQCFVESMGYADVRRFLEKRDKRFQDEDKMTRTKLAYVQLELLKPYILRLRVVEVPDRPEIGKKIYLEQKANVMCFVVSCNCDTLNISDSNIF